MDSPISRTERTLFLFVLGCIGSLLLLVGVTWGSVRFYHHWQEKNLLRQAAASLSGGDARSASASARKAYELNPASVDATRLLAMLDEKADERSALDWRRQVVALSPNSAPDQIALAACALKFSELGTAEKALALVNADQQNAAFHEAAAELAEARHRPEEAREHWARAIQLDPQNKNYQVKLASINLSLPGPEERENARAALQELRSDPAQRSAATRALITDSANGRNPDEVLRLARELQGYSGAPFQDVLLYLNVLKQMSHPDFRSYLTEAQVKASAQPADLSALIIWMNENGLSAAAVTFARSLPTNDLIRWPVPLAVADSYVASKDWAGLEAWVNAHLWGTSEFLRRAYLARAMREQQKTVAAEREWSAAKNSAAQRPRFLSTLAQTAMAWRWFDEATNLLWTLAKDPTERSEALSNLYQYYTEVGDTGGLYRTLLRLVEAKPDDQPLQNDLARIGLLLDADPERSRQIATNLYQKDPTNPAYITTYALALFSKGGVSGAVRAMAALPPKQLRDPALALYYGIFLAAAGDSAKAAEYLKLGSEQHLLPEEKALLGKAQARLLETAPN
ncbi:MAG: hypothetical protein ABI992_00330 [Chthoniobacterales bacterium]